MFAIFDEGYQSNYFASITFMKNLQVKTNFFFIRAAWGPCDHKYKKEYTFMQGD